jgi:hypothetical protein
MKKLLVFSLALISFASYGQDRINRSKLAFQQSSENLSSSTGWSYNETLGEWVDYNNTIDNDKFFKDKYKSLQGRYQMSKRVNFNNLQIKTLIFEGTKYYILIHDKWSGRYKYPSIRQDWVEFKKVDGFIFSEAEYQNLLNYKTINFYCVVEYDLEFEEYNETKFLDLIQTELSKPKDSYDRKYGSKWGMMITKTKDEKIRFLTPIILDLAVKYKQFDFTKMYFETDIGNFNKLTIK